MIRDFWTLLFFMLLVHPSWSQSAADLAQKFPHHETYEVEPGVVMWAKFASSGLVCEMSVEETHFDKNVTHFETRIEPNKISTLLDQLVPPLERGEKEQDEFSRLIAVSGPTMQRTDTYANVVVSVMWSVETHKKSATLTSSAVLKIKWRNRSCG
jgi:hypothetical protein